MPPLTAYSRIRKCPEYSNTRNNKTTPARRRLLGYYSRNRPLVAVHRRLFRETAADPRPDGESKSPELWLKLLLCAHTFCWSVSNSPSPRESFGCRRVSAFTMTPSSGKSSDVFYKVFALRTVLYKMEVLTVVQTNVLAFQSPVLSFLPVCMSSGFTRSSAV